MSIHKAATAIKQVVILNDPPRDLDAAEIRATLMSITEMRLEAGLVENWLAIGHLRQPTAE
jgi:hypothetical protein